MTSEEEKFLEIYRQETENIRFYEDLMFKLHFFAIAGSITIFGFLLQPAVPSLVVYFCSLGVRVGLFTVISLTVHSRLAHISRMKRLEVISNDLGFTKAGIYRKVKRIVMDGKTCISILLYFYIVGIYSLLL